WRGYVSIRSKSAQGAQTYALLGAASLVPAILPARTPRAAGLTAAFVYIGPRKAWGWNEPFAPAAARLGGVPQAGAVGAGTLPETTDYGSGKGTPEKPTPRR